MFMYVRFVRRPALRRRHVRPKTPEWVPRRRHPTTRAAIKIVLRRLTIVFMTDISYRMSTRAN